MSINTARAVLIVDETLGSPATLDDAVPALLVLSSPFPLILTHIDTLLKLSSSASTYKTKRLSCAAPE